MTQRDLAAFVATLSFGRAQACRNLTVLPILSSEPGSSDLLTLDEALSRELAEVTEISEEGDVPRLLFLNHGTDPVLLIDGEELVGARQNRILNLSVLAPGQQSLEIPVSCVEQGRWAWKSRRFMTSDRVIYAKLRRVNIASVSASLRRGGRRSTDQYQVWSDVSAKSARLDAHSETWAAGALYERHTADIEGFVNSFATTERQVGAAFLVDGRLAGLEVFGSTDLLLRLFPKILRGYALDALDREEPDKASDVALEPTEGLAALGKSQAIRHRAVGLGEDLRLAAPGLVGASLIAAGKVVHLTAYPKVSV